jgi:hypothetical protein
MYLEPNEMARAAAKPKAPAASANLALQFLQAFSR